MALSLGTLFVKLNADPSQLTKGMNEAADKVAKFGNKMNEISGKLGAVGVSLTALGAGALRLAGQFDANVKRATDDLGNSFNSIMVEIGRALIPVVQALSQALAVVANWMKSLSPETKQMVAGFAAVAAGSLTLTAGVGKLVGAFTSLAPVITGALTPIMPILLPVIGVIAALVAVVPIIWQAWKSNFGNVQGYTGAVIDYIADKWKAFKEYFGGVINFIGKAWNNLVGFLFRVWAAQMKSIATVAAKVAKVFGADWSRELDAFNETIDDIASRGFTGLVDDAANSIRKVGFVWEEGVSDIGQKIKDVIGGAFKGVFGEAKSGLSLLTHGVEQPPKAREAETMTFEAIDVYGKVGKKAAETTATWEAGVKLAGDNLLQGLGSFTELMNAAQAGFAAGGPWGAVAAVAAELLMKSQSFMTLVEQVNGFIQIVADQLGAVLGPNFYILGAVLKAIAPVVKILMQVLGGPLFLSLKALGLVVLGIVWALGIAWNAIIDVVSWIFNTIGDALNLIWGGLGDGMKGIAASMRAGMVDIAGVENDMRTLANMSMDQGGNLDAKGTKPIEVLGAAASETASTLNDLNASLTNIPAGFKIAAARFNATAPSIYDFGLGGNMQEVEVNLNLDGKQIHKAIVIANARGQYISRGGTPPPKWWGA